jgi:hypothetical protein
VNLVHLTEAYSPECVEGVFSEVRKDEPYPSNGKDHSFRGYAGGCFVPIVAAESREMPDQEPVEADTALRCEKDR